MGNFPVIHALSEISRSYPDIKFSQLVLAAPDVDKSEFETLGADVAKTAAGVTLYASASDIALLFSRWTRSDKPRAGDAKVPPGPAIVAGIDTVDISLLSTGFFSYFSWNHDKYADSPILLNDISNLFREGVHPPSLRNIRFRPVTQTADAIFWRFSQQ
jgi:esterase/lipase superfamily enzyme